MTARTRRTRLWVALYGLALLAVLSFVLFEVLDVDGSDFDPAPSKLAIKVAEDAHEELKRGASLPGGPLIAPALTTAPVDPSPASTALACPGRRLIGGTLALYFWSTNFNISAAVGYIAVFGVSVLNGVVLVSSIRESFADGLALRQAIVRGCEIRFRPIIVSAIVAVIGFLPAALSHGIGAEIQRPLARVVIGGLVSSTALTLLVLPAIYGLLTRWQERREPPTPDARRTGESPMAQ